MPSPEGHENQHKQQRDHGLAGSRSAERARRKEASSLADDEGTPPQQKFESSLRSSGPAHGGIKGRNTATRWKGHSGQEASTVSALILWPARPMLLMCVQFVCHFLMVKQPCSHQLGHSECNRTAMIHDTHAILCCPQYRTGSNLSLHAVPCSPLGGLSMPALPRCRPAAGGAISLTQLPRAKTAVSLLPCQRQPSPPLQVRRVDCISNTWTRLHMT